MLRERTMRIMLCYGVLWTVCIATPLHAQLRTIPRSVRDSLTNPTTANGAQALRFDRTTADMGRLNEEQTHSLVFSWTNVGTQPLVITRIVTTCRCVTVSHDKQPIPAGQQGQVTVTYHPKGHPGGFSQRLFVYTQLSDKYPSALLNITGTVETSGGTSANFPITMGALQLSRARVTFDGKSGAQMANIACLNGGNTTLRPDCDEQMLPPGFSFVCDPEILNPQEEGTLTIRYKPHADRAPLPKRIPLFLNGLGLPPSKSTILILIDNE